MHSVCSFKRSYWGLPGRSFFLGTAMATLQTVLYSVLFACALLTLHLFTKLSPEDRPVGAALAVLPLLGCASGYALKHWAVTPPTPSAR